MLIWVSRDVRDKRDDLWYNIRVEREYLEVSLTGPKARPVFGKAKPRNFPAGSKIMV